MMHRTDQHICSDAPCPTIRESMLHKQRVTWSRRVWPTPDGRSFDTSRQRGEGSRPSCTFGLQTRRYCWSPACTMQPPRRCTTQFRRFRVRVPRNALATGTFGLGTRLSDLMTSDKPPVTVLVKRAAQRLLHEVRIENPTSIQRCGSRTARFGGPWFIWCGLMTPVTASTSQDGRIHTERSRARRALQPDARSARQ
jgi:hypothetical protein